MSARLTVDPDLVLEPAAPAHAEPLFAAIDAHREDLQVWLPFVQAVRTAEPLTAFLDRWHRLAKAGRAQQWVVFHRGEAAGMVGYEAIVRAHRLSQLGYWLTPPHRGQGVAARAVTAVLDHGFGPLKLHRVEVMCAVENAPSRRLPESLGFALEGVQRQSRFLNFRWVDHACYALLRPDWEDR